MIMASGRVYSPCPLGDMLKKLSLIFKPFPADGKGSDGLAGASSTVWAPSPPPPALQFTFSQR